MSWWGSGLPYAPTIARMEQAQADRKGGILPDSAFYLEHEPVVTFGRATPAEHLAAEGPHGIPMVEVPRGGLATYHGPGQLVGYLVVDLSKRADGRPADLHAYLRAIEEGLIAFLREEYALPAGIREGFTGVWTHGFRDAGGTPAFPGRKLASIGVSCRRWVTAHGFALNIEPDMAAFRAIVPCGITDAEMTSVRRECELAGRPFDSKPMNELAARAHRHLALSLADAGWCRPESKEA